MSQPVAVDRLPDLQMPPRKRRTGPDALYVVMIVVGAILLLATSITPTAFVALVSGAGILCVLSGWILWRQLPAWGWLSAMMVLFAPGISGPIAVLGSVVICVICVLIAEGFGAPKPVSPPTPKPLILQEALTREVLIRIGTGPTGEPLYARQAIPTLAQQSGKTNTLAILALVFGVMGGVAAIPLGHIAVAQIKRTGENGRGLAIAGLVLGYAWAALILLYVLVIAVLFAQYS